MARRNDDFSSERWAQVEEFPDYEVSDHGCVRRVTASMGATVGKVLRPGTDPKHGRRFVHLRRKGRLGATRRVHTLVALAFIGPRPDGCEVNHKDFDPGNNHYLNLEYLTHADNNRYSAAAGRMRPPVARGEASSNSKLTEEQVREMRRRRASGERVARLAAVFGVSQRVVSLITTRKAWTHVV